MVFPRNNYLIFFLLCVFSQITLTAQVKDSLVLKDTTVPGALLHPTSPAADSLPQKRHKERTPRGAAIRSAILPGLGQAYNHKYWKIPVVYAVMGTTGWYFLYNLQWYHRYRFAYTVAYNKDSANFSKVYKQLQPVLDRVEALQFARDKTRREVDYAGLYFLIAWALNVVEASVDAHLSGFDISPNLSLRVKPGHSSLANTNGLSLVVGLK